MHLMLHGCILRQRVHAAPGRLDHCAAAECLHCHECARPDAQLFVQDNIIKIGYLNRLFVLAPSIRLISDALDQKRLQAAVLQLLMHDLCCRTSSRSAT